MSVTAGGGDGTSVPGRVKGDCDEQREEDHNYHFGTGVAS